MPGLLQETLPAQAAAGADIRTELGETASVGHGTNAEITAMRLTSPVTVTGQATNNATISIRRYRAGAFKETSAQITLGAGVSLPAETSVDLPVTGSVYVQPGDVFEVLQHQNGTGLALPAGMVAEVEIA